MKTDRELLELAARVAGIQILWKHGVAYKSHNGVRQSEWMPLTDDGDALRLAVKLEITVEHGDKTAWAYSSAGFEGNADERYGDDAMQATRRAIVRAAAAIGESMK